MDPLVILQAGVATGTVLLFATLGEILAERSGVMNLGVEGMMLIGAMTGFSVSLATGNPWLGLLMAMLAAGLLSIAHGVVTISFQADQVVSGLALTFLGTGLALVLGNGLTGQNPPLIVVHGSALSHIPDAYRRYLERFFAEAFKLRGTPLRIQFKTGANPYAKSATRRPGR